MIEVYTKAYCPYCIQAKSLFDKLGYKYIEIDILENPEQRQKMISRSNRTTVPQIFIDDHHIGGCDDLFALQKQGKLEPLLKLETKEDI